MQLHKHMFAVCRWHKRSYLRFLGVPDKIHTLFRLFSTCLLNIWLSYTTVGWSIGKKLVHWLCHPLSLSFSFFSSQSRSLVPIRPLWCLFIHRILPYFHRDSVPDDFYPIHRILDSMYFVFHPQWWMICVKTLLAIRRRRCCDDGEAVCIRAGRLEAQQSPALDLQPWPSDWTPTADYLTTTLRDIPILAIHINVRYVFIRLLFE